MGNVNSNQLQNSTSLCDSLKNLDSVDNTYNFLRDPDTLKDPKYSTNCPSTEHDEPFKYTNDPESDNIINGHIMNINISKKNAKELKNKYDKLVTSLMLNKASVKENGRVLLIQNIVTISFIVIALLLFTYLSYSYDFIEKHKIKFLSIVIILLLCLCYYIYSFITTITSMSDVTRNSFFKIGDSSTSFVGSIYRGINKGFGNLD